MRFIVVRSMESFWIRDNEANRYLMTERAVSINFRLEANAQVTCDLLNREWERFLANPT